MADPRPLDDDVILMEFAAEQIHDQRTLERYLRAHPHLADDLIDLSLDLRLQQVTAATTVPADEAWVEASLTAFRTIPIVATSRAPATDPFAAMAPADFVTLRRQLDVPSGVIEGFRTRVVEIATVPERFLDSLARGLGTAVGDLRAFMTAPPRLAPRLSYKSDEAPAAVENRISFEQLLVQCHVPDERRRLLLTDID
jgi:hypothetical protein